MKFGPYPRCWVLTCRLMPTMERKTLPQLGHRHLYITFTEFWGTNRARGTPSWVTTAPGGAVLGVLVFFWYLSLPRSRLVEEKGVGVGLEAVVSRRGAQGLAGVLGAALGVRGRGGGDVAAPAPVPAGGAAAAVRHVAALLPGITHCPRGCTEGDTQPLSPWGGPKPPLGGLRAAPRLDITMRTFPFYLFHIFTQSLCAFARCQLPLLPHFPVLVRSQRAASAGARTLPTAPSCYFYPPGSI